MSKKLTRFPESHHDDRRTQRQLQIDCRAMTLVQNTSDSAVSYRGKGYIRQTDDDTLTFKLYATETRNTDQFADLNRAFGAKPGKIYEPSAYFTLTAVDFDGAIWTAERILPRCNWRHDDGNPIVHGGLWTVAIDHPTESQDHTLSLHYFEKAEIPCIIDTIKFSAAGAAFTVSSGNEIFRVDVNAGEPLPEYFHTRVEEALRFLLAQSVSWRVLVSTDRGRYRLELAAAKRRSRKTLLDPPIYRGSHSFLEHSWHLFGLYLQYVIKTPHPYWNLCSYHLHNACEASANSIDASAIALSVAVEGIVSLLTMELPEEKLIRLEALRTFVIAQVSASDAHRIDTDRIKGMMAGLTKVRAVDKLRRLAEEGKVDRAQIAAWQELRNKQVHPVPAKLADIASRDYQRPFDLIHQTTVLMYHVVFQLIGYEGTYTDYATHGYPNRDYPAALSESKTVVASGISRAVQ
jgi:hypothetical protein